MKFGDKLLGLRKKNGLSQEELAEKLGVSRQSVSKWESNNAYPETDKIVQICNIFNCSMDDLINDSITDLNQIDRKEKNNLAKSMDSFLDFITKTINMFSDMKFGSGLKCVIKMGLLALLLFFVGLFVVGVTGSVIGNCFSLLKHHYIIESIITSVLRVAWFVFSVIVLVYTFKTRYLDYYVKAKEEKQENSNTSEKIELKPTEKVIIRDPADKEYAFLTVLAKIVKFFVKIFLGLFVLELIPLLVAFAVVFVLSLMHIGVSIFFVGLTLSMLSAVLITIVFLIFFINFIFNKKSKYKTLLIMFLTSLVLFGIGVGISVISFKNFKIGDAKTLINDTKVIDINYSDNLVVATSGLGDLNYEYDESLGNSVKIEIQYNNKFNKVETSSENYYGARVFVIDRFNTDFNMKDTYDVIINDIKNNTIRSYDDSYIITIKSSKAIIDKIIDNTSKVYYFNKTKTDNGYKIDSVFHRINEYNSCDQEIEYNAFTNELKAPASCKCERIVKDDYTSINCE